MGSFERQALRDERPRPVLKEFKGWVDRLKPKVVPKTLLYESATYAQNQWCRDERWWSPPLRRFCAIRRWAVRPGGDWS
jgi:Transposase IS66 family